jgi:hypothetical protein
VQLDDGTICTSYYFHDTQKIALSERATHYAQHAGARYIACTHYHV